MTLPVFLYFPWRREKLGWINHPNSEKETERAKRVFCCQSQHQHGADPINIELFFFENKRKLLERIKIYHRYAREWRRMFLLSRQEFGIPHSTAFIFHPRFHPPFSHVSFRKKGIFFLYYKCCRVLYIKMHHRKGFPFIICTWKTRKLSPSCRIDP